VCWVVDCRGDVANRDREIDGSTVIETDRQYRATASVSWWACRRNRCRALACRWILPVRQQAIGL